MEINQKSDITQNTAAKAGANDIHTHLSDALSKISICMRSINQYGISHPIINEMVDAAFKSISELMIIQPTVTVVCLNKCFVLDSFPIDDPSKCLEGFAKALSDRGIGELKIIADIEKREIIEFAEALSLTVENLILRGGIAEEIRRRKIVNLQVSSAVLPVEFRDAKDPADIYEEALLLVDEAMKAVESGLQIPVPEIRAVVADSLRSLTHDDSILLALTGIRSYDHYLSEHSVNVCILSMVLSKDIGLDSASALELGVSAMLHDVGKVFVPIEIVQKPGKLSEEEWQQIRRHPVEGARALAGITDLPALASTIALEHHIGADGSGYPAVPLYSKPHLLSRLVQIVDVYDALTTIRPYRERWTGPQAIAWMLYEAHGQFDRRLLARFATRTKLYPLGSIVKLCRGDYAVVVGGSHKHPRNPIVRIITGSNSDNSPLEVDLSTNTDPAFQIDSMAQPVEALLPYTDKLMAA